MAGSAGSIIGRMIGLVVGLAVAAAAIWSVFFVDWSREKPVPAPIVRPVQMLEVGRGPERVRTFPARVRATNEATLAFQVSGVLASLPVIRGQRVKQGELLAELDLRDFESRLRGAQANVERLTDELAAVTRAFEQQAANQIEVTRFRSSLDNAVAERDIAAKALEDATLLAPFDGRVADVFVENFEKVAPGTRILRIQGNQPIRVEVNVDAARVALHGALQPSLEHAVRFDFLPEREYRATLVEFTTEADRTTQTFRAILELEPPEEVVILPGMTATLIERRTAASEAPAGEPIVPLGAVATDGLGRSYVWLVGDAGADGVASVTRREVALGAVYGDGVVVTRGLARGERIVVAGVRELADGQRVRVAAPRDQVGSVGSTTR